MACPIKETPVLTGEDARRFDKQIRLNEQESSKVSAEEYQRALAVYHNIRPSGDEVSVLLKR